MLRLRANVTTICFIVILLYTIKSAKLNCTKPIVSWMTDSVTWLIYQMKQCVLQIYSRSPPEIVPASCMIASYLIWISHVETEYVNESCHIHETWLHASCMIASCLFHLHFCIVHMKETWRDRVCEWVMSCTWDMTACVMDEWVISHSFTLLHLPYERDMMQQSLWMSHVTYMRHDCMHHAWVNHISFIYSIASSIWKRHDATEYVNESCHIYASCMTCIMHESHDLWSSDKSFKKTLRLMNNCPQDLLLSFFLFSLTNQHFGLGCGLLKQPFF